MAFCDQCGTKLDDRARFCPNCGAPRADAAEPAPPEPPATAEPPTAGKEKPPAPPAELPLAPPKAPPRAAGAPPAEPVAEQPPSKPLNDGPPPEPPRAAAEPASARAAAEPSAPAAEEEPPSEPVAEGRRSGGAQAELVGQLGELGQTPAAVAAGVIGLGTFAVVVIAGFVLAALPDASLIGFLGADAGYVEEAFRQMVQLVLAGFENDSLFEAFRNTSRVAPGLFALVPVLASLSLARAQLTRLQGASLGLRLGVAVGGAFLFALLMIIPALLTGDLDASVGQAFGYGLLWALVGSLAGTVLAAPPTLEHERSRTIGRLVLTALKPLGLALLVTTVLGTAIWIVDVATDGDTRGSRSLPIALVDTTLYAVDHGVHTFELGSLAAFERRALQPEVLALPLPAEDPGAIIGSSSETFRIFAYNDGVSAVVFLLMLVLLIGIPLVAALYAGFLVAGERGVTTPVLAAAWGALVGPIWAIVLAIVNALLQDTLFGHAQGESVFGIVLVFGAAIGAGGGFLAGRASSTVPSASAGRRPGDATPPAAA